MKSISTLTAGLLLGAAPLLAKPSFPGAEGHGREARGGRGGAVIAVTTLADAGPGSLRACIDAAGPRVCIFRVAGVIRFTTERPIIRNPYLTIAGESAPGDGILLTHAGGPTGLSPIALKKTHDIVIRHIRVRMDRRGDNRGSNSGVSLESARNIMIDHVSTSWALDQNFGAYAFNDRVTVSWSIFAEGIPPHDKCALMASHPGKPQRFSFIRNLCAHNGDRNPDANFMPGSCVEIVNNVFYNAESQFTEIWGSWGGTPASVIGNTYRRGPNTIAAAAAIDRPLIGATGMARIYQAGNSLDGVAALFTPSARLAIAASPSCPAATTPTPAAAAYAAVLAGAGAQPRDAVDARIIGEVRSRSGVIVRAPGILPTIAGGLAEPDTDADGMPDDWEARNGTDPNAADAWDDANRDGWLNLENFLDARHRRLTATQRRLTVRAKAASPSLVRRN
ncbi:hypothetical protein GCM10011529_21020 [Polymorphobacter glacialis]|uniref:Pectate lyase n=1 Tax=Sandarakinorhabdus glacialis TaxID=1614636 RepID=A0A917E872_9SPHN|nr:pectate lyase [Polymorphobacter glacialis]GGE14448.1 hypothetical protein GCM10011529_21020 [Polymorphobacter glacialis]